MPRTDSPRILHIASGDLWAGAEVQLYTLVKTLHGQMNVPVSVVLLNHGVLEQKLKDSGIPVIILDESKLNGFHIIYHLYRSIKALQPDVIHTHRIKENILGSIAGLLNGGIASLRTLHGVPEHPPNWRKLPQRLVHFTDWFCGRFIQRRIILVSESLVKIISSIYPMKKITVIENGIDVASILSASSTGPNNIALNHGTLKIGLSGRMVPVKRVDLFIRTAKYIIGKHPDLNCSFHIFGDGPLRKELHELAVQLDIQEAIVFEGHRDDMLDRLGKLDMLLMTSDDEGLPMVLLEAMVLRVPIVAHATGGITKLLDNGSCGILVTDHTPSGYASAIMQLMDNPDVRTRITDEASDRVARDFSSEINANAYLSEYLSINRAPS